MTRARTLSSRALSGLKIKVIDQNSDYDAKGAIETQLEALGAQSGSSLKSCPYKALTHIVIVQRNKRSQDSLRSTIDWLSRVAPSAKVVDQLWVKSCVEASSLVQVEQVFVSLHCWCVILEALMSDVQEQPFQIDLENIPVISHTRPRRGRGNLPAKCEKLQLDLDTAFFSSTQALESDLKPKAARTALAPRRPGINQQANKNVRARSQSRLLAQSSDCRSSINEPSAQLPAVAPAAPRSVPVAQQSRRAQSMPDRRISRELHSLGVSHNRNIWRGASPSFPAPYSAGDAALKPSSMEPLAGSLLCQRSSSTLRDLNRGKARTRARAPALGFMLARANMQLPITKDDVALGRRTDGASVLPWQPEAVTPKRTIPVPVVREVEWLSAPVPPRCRRCEALAEAAMLQGYEAACAGTVAHGLHTDAISSEQAVVRGIWTDMRVWDWECPHHRTPTVLLPNLETGVLESNTAADSHHAEQQISDPAVLSPRPEALSPEIAPQDFPALAAMGHGTRGRLSALVAVLDSGDSPHEDNEQGHSLPVEGEGTHAVLDALDVQSQPLCGVQEDATHPLPNSQAAEDHHAHACTSVGTRRGELGCTDKATKRAKCAEQEVGIQKQSAPQQGPSTGLDTETCGRPAATLREVVHLNGLADDSHAKSCQRASTAANDSMWQAQKSQRSASDVANIHYPGDCSNTTPKQSDGFPALVKRVTRSKKREGIIAAILNMEKAENSEIARVWSVDRAANVGTGRGRKRRRDDSAGLEGQAVKESCIAVQGSCINKAVEAMPHVGRMPHEGKAVASPGSLAVNVNPNTAGISKQKTSAAHVYAPVLRSARTLSDTRNGLSADEFMTQQVNTTHEHISAEGTATQGQNGAQRKACKGSMNGGCTAANANGSEGWSAEQRNSAYHVQQSRIDMPTADGMCIACSGVAQDVLERCKRAVRTLGNAQLVESEDEVFSTTVTHLVIDGCKRSSKLLHAVACGAQIVTPAWLVQCIRWRGWVACDDYLCQHVSMETLGRARDWASGKRPPPLQDVHCHLITSAGTIKTECPRMNLCRQLVQRLGGQITAARRCDVCVVVSLTSPSQQTDGSRNSNESGKRKSFKSRSKRPDVGAGRLRLPDKAVIVLESWLVETLLMGKKQPPGKHIYKRS